MRLPPLPAPWSMSETSPAQYYFTAEQMHDYARAALAEQPQPVNECADNDSPWLICKPCAASGKCAKEQAQPVATLHDDGCFTWKRDEFRRRYDRQRAGWRMDVYATPPAPVVPQPLTPVQITELAEQCGYDGAVATVRLAFQGFKLDDFARAVEAAVLERMGVQR